MNGVNEWRLAKEINMWQALRDKVELTTKDLNRREDRHEVKKRNPIL